MQPLTITVSVGAHGPTLTPGPSAWAVRLSTTTPGASGRTVSKQWRGLLPRSTAERARHHAVIEALRRLQPDQAVVLHTTALREPGLSDAADALAQRHTVTYRYGPGFNRAAQEYLKQNLTARAAREPSQWDLAVLWTPAVWVPVPLARSTVSAALTWDALGPKHGHAQLLDTHDGAALCRVTLPYPFLDETFSFAPNGARIPGSWLREVQRPRTAAPDSAAPDSAAPDSAAPALFVDVHREAAAVREAQSAGAAP